MTSSLPNAADEYGTSATTSDQHEVEEEQETKYNILMKILRHSTRNSFLRHITKNQLIDIILLTSNRTPTGQMLHGREECREVRFDLSHQGELVLPATSPVLLQRIDVETLLSFYEKIHGVVDLDDKRSAGGGSAGGGAGAGAGAGGAGHEYRTTRKERKMLDVLSSLVIQSATSPIQILHSYLKKEIVGHSMTNIDSKLFDYLDSVSNGLHGFFDESEIPLEHPSAPLHPHVATFLFFFNDRFLRQRWDMFGEIYMHGPLDQVRNFSLLWTILFLVLT